MPNAIKNGGLLFGAVGTLVIGFVCAHCVHILVKSSHVLCRRTKTPKMTYAETACAAFQCGPKILRPFANFSKVFVNAALCATYVGGACVYVVFVSESIKQVADYYSGMNIPIRLYMVTLIPAVVLLGQIRNLKYLVPFSMIANISIVIGFAIMMYYLFEDIKPISSVNLVASLPQIPKFFATVIFAIEGIGVVMPVENSMKKPHHFLGCPGVLNVTMSTVVALYAIIGVFGYLKYGDATKGSVTFSLEISDVLGQVVKLSIALAVLFTYGLQYSVPLDIIWCSMKGWFSHQYAGIGETIVRFFMVMVTVCVAALVPELDPFISLVGALFFSVLGISIPAIIETISCWDGHLGTCKWRLWKNLLLLVFSVFALISGSWMSIMDIINLYK
ncbi:proton-coupled amino acid transporter-like protein pathetic isoform X2 [Orussus abietinus]|nr:proton-coupled amino acid transporter-like protein pathetic isoform X2 [Orussus abietinus]